MGCVRGSVGNVNVSAVLNYRGLCAMGDAIGGAIPIRGRRFRLSFSWWVFGVLCRGARAGTLCFWIIGVFDV